MKTLIILVIAFLVALGGGIWGFVSVAQEKPANGVLALILFIIGTIFFVTATESLKYDNEVLKSYEFPASAYKVETRVKEEVTYSVRDGVVVENKAVDTLYVITGVEPIMFRGEKQRGKELLEVKTYYLAK